MKKRQPNEPVGQKLKAKANLPPVSAHGDITFFKGGLAMALICAIFAFVLYSNTIGYNYVLDDSAVITLNPIVLKGFAGIPDLFSVEMWHFNNANLGYYRPLSLVTFAIENQFFPQNAHVSHFSNIIFYALTGFFLCLWLMRLFRNYNPVFAFLITLIFIAHPIHTEVVANIKSRDEILSFLNLIISAYILLSALKPAGINYKLLGLSCFFFYLALLSKESAVAGFILVPLTLYLAPVSISNKNAKEGAPFTGIGKIVLYSVPFLLLIFLFQVQKLNVTGSFTGDQLYDIVNYPYSDAGLPCMFLIFTWCVKLILFPFPLSYNYAYNQIPAAGWSSPFVLGGVIMAALLLFFSLWKLKNKSPLSIAAIIFGATLVPAMAFVLIKGGIMAERFLYAPALGFSIGLTWLTLTLLKIDIKTAGITLTRNVKLIIPFALLLGLYSFQTITRNPVWHDNLTLFKHDAAVADNSCQTHYHYGHELIQLAVESNDSTAKQHYFNEGVTQFRKSLQINPHFAEACFGMGSAYQKIPVRYDSAVYYYKKAIEFSPNYDIAYNQLGVIAEYTGRHYLASYYYNRALQANPYCVPARANHDRHSSRSGLDVKTLPAGESF